MSQCSTMPRESRRDSSVKAPQLARREVVQHVIGQHEVEALAVGQQVGAVGAQERRRAAARAGERHLERTRVGVDADPLDIETVPLRSARERAITSPPPQPRSSTRAGRSRVARKGRMRER